MKDILKDIMTQEVECATPDMSVQEAAEIMKNKDIGSLPVCEGRKVTGIVTDRDITIRGVAEKRDLATTKVSELMSRDVVSVREDAGLKDAERVMSDRQLRRLPVVDAKGEITGYLTLAKVARQDSAARVGDVIKGVSRKSA